MPFALESNEHSTTEIVTKVFIVPSIKKSSIELTVIVCGIFQLELVNVREVRDNEISEVLELVKDKITSEAGWASKTTVKVTV
jgi:hypothetical protein